MFTVQSVEDLVWGDADKTHFTCLVKYAEFNEKHPSAITPNDIYAHIIEIWTRANAGEFGEIADYFPPVAQVAPVATEPQPIAQGAQSL
jgi:hypothetical protein